MSPSRIMAAALGQVARQPWTLDIVGDGEAREEVERLFAPFGNRFRLHGQIERRVELQALYEKADLFVWPAVNEAYGMVLLEAQSFGCPVAAGDFGGVSSVVRHGQTGLLTSPGDAADFARAVSGLLADRERCRLLGEAARRFVREERDIDQAAGRLRAALNSLMLGRGA